MGELALGLAAPVITTYMGTGLLGRDHPCVVPGPVHAREVGVLWDDADVVVAIGSDFDGTMTQNWQMPAPPALISVNVDEAEANKNYRATVTLVGDTPLCERYRRALAIARVNATIGSPDAAARGLWRIAQHAGLVRR